MIQDLHYRYAFNSDTTSFCAGNFTQMNIQMNRLLNIIAIRVNKNYDKTITRVKTHLYSTTCCKRIYYFTLTSELTHHQSFIIIQAKRM